MLPRVIPEQTVAKVYQDYLLGLANAQFSGDIQIDYATRLSVATDNSVYQVVPQAVIFPRNTQDIVIALQLCQQKSFKEIKFAPRGGGTATNGQSLSAGIIVDCSRHMRTILELNLKENWVRVQPGVVLDQLNDFLKPHGVYFAPEISPSNRATLGGMINTDACGNGSKVIGRTSDHILNLVCVLSDGKVIETEKTHEHDELNQKLKKLLTPHTALIQEKFIERPRNLNGYNLLKSISDNKINLNYLFSGSEGTLGIICECKLKVTPIPRYKKLVLVKYHNFDEALRSHNILNKVKPFVIEAIDNRLLELAREDAIYFKIKDMLDGDKKAGAINLVEFVAESEEEVSRSVYSLCEEIEKNQAALGYYIAKNDVEIKLLWELRKKSVGLISKKQQGMRRPIPFVEDTAVPPEKLADYIHEFKKILDKHQLIYGMYGHVDAGCVHVRPALDLKQNEDETLFRELSDSVAKLVEQFNGVMWGEHGMGFRCHYAEHFFGEKLYHVVRQIKTLFDPDNRLNPGKIATSLTSEAGLVDFMGPLRAKVDKQIPAVIQQEYAMTMACNGNGACFNYATQDAMCPSFKVTQDRIHSPKGRATVVREWLRLLSKSNDQNFLLQSSEKTNQNFFQKCFFVIPRWIKKYFHGVKKQDFSHEVYSAMNGCLSCKACAFQCPLNIDIPETKSRFLEKYHLRYLRPFRDYLVGFVEIIAPIQAYFPRIFNLILQSNIVKAIFCRVFKLVDIPAINILYDKTKLKKINESKGKIFELTRECSPDSKKLKADEVKSWEDFSQLSVEQKMKSVILLQDVFTTYYEPDLVEKICQFLIKSGFKVIMLPFFPNGKPLHVKGFLSRFSRLAKRNNNYLQKIAKIGIPIVGIDPSVTLTYRDEYVKLLYPESPKVEIKLLQEWLVENLDKIDKIEMKEPKKAYHLLSHCTEKTASIAAEKQWQTLFAAYGLILAPLAVGCCGMAGSFGHEVEHVQQSKALYGMDWERYVNEIPVGAILATGYSCRSQIKRFSKIAIRHPIEVFFDK